MKKKIVALVAVLAMCLSMFLGCNLISKNEERDLNQVVATVGEIQIRKKELRDSFLTSGYQYMQNGMSQEEAVDTTLDLMIKREVMVQKAIAEMSTADEKTIKSLSLDENTSDSESIKQDKKRIIEVIKGISQQKIDEIEWQIWQSKYEMLQDYEKDYLTKATTEEKKTMSKETYDDDRAVRTNPNADSDVVNIGKIPNYAAKDANGNYIDTVQGAAYEELARKIKSSYSQTLDEFNYNVLRTYLESELINAYSDKLIGDYLIDYVDADGNATDKLWKEVEKLANETIEAQRESYRLDSSLYANALSSDSGSLPIAVGQAGYAQVKQILIQFDDQTASKLKSLQTDDNKDKEAYEKARLELAKELKLVDQRQKKILNTNYDSNYLATDKVDENGKPSATGTWRSDDWYTSDEYKQGYNDRYLPGYADAFPNWVSSAGSASDFAELKNAIIAELNAIVDAKPAANVNKGMTVEADAFVDLIYKYNEDPGMMKEYANYVITPGNKVGETGQWVAEFDEAARRAVEQFKNAGAGATASDRIEIAVSDYGIHIIYVTAVYDDTAAVINPVLKEEINTKNTSAYYIREQLLANKEGTFFNDFVNKYYDEVKKDGKTVSINTKAYKSFYKEDFFK